jgi:hypothetical protein
MARHATAAPPDMPGVPPGVAAVVRRLMAKRPADRFQTPGELIGAIAAAPTATVVDHRNAPPAATPPPPDEVPTRSLPPAEPIPLELQQEVPSARRSGPRWWAVGAVVAGLLAVVALVVALLQDGEPTGKANPGGNGGRWAGRD